MADVEPLHALHYDLAKVGGLQPVAAPPYDVIDAAQRAELLGRSPYNVVEVDLPQNGARSLRPRGRASSRAGATRGSSSATRRPRCGRSRRTTPARTGSRAPATASSRACRSRTTAPAASARTSARTRARRRTGCASRAPRARTSPRSSASTTTRPTPPGARSSRSRTASPWGEVTDDEGTVHKLWRVDDPQRDRRLQGRAQGHRAADRRRPPPLRDRPRLPAGGAERRPRADVPGRAAGRRPDRLPDAPPRDRPRRRPEGTRSRPRSSATGRPSRRTR